jgi:hypothetical protein
MTRAEQRQESYRRQRAYLVALLGGRCVDCGEDDPRQLEFDHVGRRTWTARDTSRWVRVARYGREAFRVTECGRLEATGQIVLRCDPCNRAKGQPPLPDEIPF